MTLDEKIDFFFTDPTVAVTADLRSVLYLVRQEAQDCLIGRVVPEDQAIAEARKEPHRIFATTMVLMTGVDLLAKFYAGSDTKGEVSSRFRTFAERYFVGDAANAHLRAEALYLGLRNPLTHAFNIGSDQYRMHLVLFQGADEPVWLRVADHRDVVISVAGVYRGFVRAVGQYQADLRASDDLKAKFERMFERYGQIGCYLRAGDGLPTTM